MVYDLSILPVALIDAAESPPHVFARLPARFVERLGWDNAALPACLGRHVCGLAGKLSRPGVASAVGQPRRFGEPGDQRPLTDHRLPFTAEK